MDSSHQLQMIIPYFMELYNKVYKKILGGCTTRAQLLYLQLKHMGYNPIIFRYFIKGEQNKNADERKRITLLDDQKFLSHVVILLDNFILDTNIPEILTKEKYEKRTKEKSVLEIIGLEYGRRIEYKSCKRYVDEYGLDLFRHLFYNNNYDASDQP